MRSGTTPIRVLQLLQGLNIGGIERMVVSLVRGLDGSEVRTSFCTFDWKGKLAGQLEERGYRLHHRKRRGPLDLRFVAWLVGLLRGERAHVVHAHNATALLYGVAATTLVRGTRLLYTEHDRAFPSSLRERGLHALLACRTHAVATVSETLRGHLVRYERFPSRRVHVIRNGVELAAAARCRDEVRGELGLAARPVAGIVARLAPVKNHALLLRAWKRVLREIPDAVLLVVGNGSQEAALRALAAELELGDAVRFLGFRLDVTELLQAMDVFVLSSMSEGLSLTLLEAEASGLPIVATRVGGNPEVVRDGETGALVPPGQEEPLAGALARLLQDPALRTRLGERGRSLYRKHYTLQGMVRGYTRLYRQLCGLPGPGLADGDEPHVELAAAGGGS
ncbi:MAG: glycosyltransferase [Candidatus Krumholzibacteriia bacterium]